MEYRSDAAWRYDDDDHRTFGYRCVSAAHAIEPRPAEHPSRTCVGKYAPRHDSARMAGDEPSRTARKHPTHACSSAWRLMRLYTPRASRASDAAACSPRFRSETTARPLAAKSLARLRQYHFK
jgi:hypothetical protein